MHRMLVNQIMQGSVITIHPTALAADAAQTMEEFGIRRLPVVDENGTLAGIIAMADIALEMEDQQELADALEEISSGSGFWSKK